MTIKALIFDVDGTMADTEEAHRRAFNIAFIEHQLEWVWDRPLYAQLLEVSGGKERIASYIDALPLAAAEKIRLRQRVPVIHGDKTRVYADLVSSGNVPLRPGVARLFNAARVAGVRLAVASTTTRVNVDALVAATLGEGALAWFSVIACGDQVPNKKPAPDIYLRALSALDVRTEHCVAFEDSANGLKAAHAAGLFTVVTPTRWTANHDFSEAQAVLGSLDELSRPAAALSAAIPDAFRHRMVGLAHLLDAGARRSPAPASAGRSC